MSRGLKPRKLTAADLDPARFLDDEVEDGGVAAVPQSPSADPAPQAGEHDAPTDAPGIANGDAADAEAEVTEETLQQLAEEMAKLPMGAPEKKELYKQYKEVKKKLLPVAAKHESPTAEPENGGTDTDDCPDLIFDDAETFSDDILDDELDFDCDDEDGHSEQSAPENFECVEAGISDQAREALFAKLDQEQRLYVGIPRWLSRLQERPSAAGLIVLSQLIYWTDPKHGHPPQPHRGIFGRWTAKSDVDLAGETALSENEVNKALAQLKSLAYIAWQVRKFSNQRKRHIWINWDKLLDAYEEPIDQAT